MANEFLAALAANPPSYWDQQAIANNQSALTGYTIPNSGGQLATVGQLFGPGNIQPVSSQIAPIGVPSILQGVDQIVPGGISSISSFFSNPLQYFTNIFGQYAPIALGAAAYFILPKLVPKYGRQIRAIVPLATLGYMATRDSQANAFMSSPLGIASMVSSPVAKVAFPLAILSGAVPALIGALGLVAVNAMKSRTYRRKRYTRTRKIYIRRR